VENVLKCSAVLLFLLFPTIPLLASRDSPFKYIFEGALSCSLKLGRKFSRFWLDISACRYFNFRITRILYTGRYSVLNGQSLQTFDVSFTKDHLPPGLGLFPAVFSSVADRNTYNFSDLDPEEFRMEIDLDSIYFRGLIGNIYLTS
jgi:hypothetical protein